MTVRINSRISLDIEPVGDNYQISDGKGLEFIINEDLIVEGLTVLEAYTINDLSSIFTTASREVKKALRDKQYQDWMGDNE